MNYNIDDIVLFNADLNTLTQTETHESISLTLSQSLLLELMLKSKSEILSRDSIIDTLWHSHGINSSGHTLNQYISLLRRMFAHFGLNELIITIPRVGIRLNPDVRVSECTEDRGPAVTTERVELSQASGSGKRTAPPLRRYMISLLLWLIAGLVPVLFFYHADSNKQSLNVVTYDGCQIGLLGHFTPADRTFIYGQVREIMVENKLLCGKDRSLFFGFNKSNAGQDLGRTFLAFCIKGDNKRLISCDNYYYRNWRVE